MTEKKLYNEAQTIQNDLVEYRRFLHAHAETGFALKNTVRFVEEKLKGMGYAPVACGKSCLVACVGQAAQNKGAGKAFLLRADMDALPITEKSGVPFACKTGNMHACGHDMHTAMLLGAARLLKTHERELKGRVKLVFQPAEETLEGAKAAIAAGVLKDPDVGGATTLHVMTASPLKSGTLVVFSEGVSAPAADYFTITVKGKSCHGSTPQNGVDAINAAAHILVALQEIAARELSVSDDCVLTVGNVQGGTAPNVIADLVKMQGTLRSYTEEVRERTKKRLSEICASVAKAFRARAKVTFDSGCPTLVNDGALSHLAEKVARETLGTERVLTTAGLGGGTNARGGGSEDFAYISHQIPSVALALAAGERGKGFDYPLHHPKVRFDESVLPIGSAVLAAMAFRYFER